jgi:hypothetical protein
MSELTERVRKMLSQAQVFARDTPFEAVSRVRQAISVIDQAIADTGTLEEDRSALTSLRSLAASRAAKYEAGLQAWLAESEARADQFTANERERLAQPMRAKV